MRMNGQIVIVNGTSGSGKSTTCEAFAARRDDFWLLFGIDHFIAGSFPSKFGHHGPRAAEGFQAVPLDPADPDGPLRWRFGPEGERAFATMHEWIAASSRTGCNLIFDHILMSDPPVIADLAWRMEGLPALLVTLKPPIEVLEQRVANRKMTKKLPTEVLGEDDPTVRIIDRLNRLRGWFYDDVYSNDVADLVIDTSANDTDAVVALIEARLAQGPGNAFATLRDKFVRPW
jgi:chloramphenicol 3-O-phosphotransferase